MATGSPGPQSAELAGWGVAEKLAERVKVLEEVLRRVVMDYGDNCTTEGCECSMAQAKREVGT